MANINALKSQAAKLVVKASYAKALQIYEKVKEMDPDEPGTYNLIGDVYLKMGQKENAVKEFKDALEMYKKVQYYPNAIAVCKKILRTDKEQTEVYYDLADLYVERGFIGEAVINYLEYASRMRKEGNKKKEIEAYKKVIELGPSKVDIRERLVDLYIAESETEAAIEELEKIEELLIQQGKQAKLPEIEAKLAQLKIAAPTKKKEAPKAEKKPAKEEPAEDLVVQQGFTMEDMMDGKVAVEEKKPPPPKEKPEKKEEKGDEVSLEDEIAKLSTADMPQGEEVTVENLPPPDKAELQTAPAQWTNFEELAELCLSVNSKSEAVDYLYKAGQMYLEENNYSKAIRVYKKIIDIRPLELRPRQKLIEISLKSADKESAAEWNIDLGKCLYKKGATDEAEKAFSRALDLTSKKDRVKKTIEHIRGRGKVEEKVEEKPAKKAEKKKAEKKKEEVPKKAAPVSQSISLGELLEEEEKRSVKFTVADEKEVEEPVTFEDLLEEFKEGVLENIEDKDFDSHYDLGITYKEMGLLDEAVQEFEKASKGKTVKLKSTEMLSLCLIEKGDLTGAEKVISEAIALKGHDESEYLGLKYSLAQIYERINKNEEAIELFKQIFATDAEFKDARAKLTELEERVGKKKGAAKKEEPAKAAKAKEEKEKPKEKPEEEPPTKKEAAKEEKPKAKVSSKRKKKISYI